MNRQPTKSVYLVCIDSIGLVTALKKRRTRWQWFLRWLEPELEK